MLVGHQSGEPIGTQEEPISGEERQRLDNRCDLAFHSHITGELPTGGMGAFLFWGDLSALPQECYNGVILCQRQETISVEEIETAIAEVRQSHLGIMEPGHDDGRAQTMQSHTPGTLRSQVLAQFHDALTQDAFPYLDLSGVSSCQPARQQGRQDGDHGLRGDSRTTHYCTQRKERF
ncbi:hypothetical protein KSB_48340 [Ktedonobacter robiniae]|uniref:Uncharacterized protein n=1 Tax=Ktedonobacter robiniae TaxID=2778365 RepID=A0ABQ3UU42_9CHLR|nr:hypothetical protein KSB_48340 [Ktedonobacter robiniae]